MFLTTMALCFGATTVSRAVVYWVSPDDDIQLAVDAASTGDTIQFAAGTYTVTNELYIYNKGITLQGMGKAMGTIIQRDAGSLDEHRILHIEAPEGVYNPDISTVITGFTFKNGIAASGGNILVKESPYTIIENSIIENGKASNGGGISLEVGGTLRNSIIRNNTTPSGSLNMGGGVYMRYGANFLENSIVYDNWANVGGGVVLQYGGSANEPLPDGKDSRARVTNSTIANNTVSGYYGALFGGGVGAQLFGTEAFITDSIVAGNLGGTSTNDIENIPYSGGTLTVTYTDNGAGPYPGTGNINADPLFTGSGDPWDYYRLQAGSPALTSSSIGGIMGAQLHLSIFQVPDPAPEVTITAIDVNGGNLILQWQSNRTNLLYRVEVSTNLSSAAWSPATPTSQWWISETVWTNTSPTRNREFMRIKAKEQ